MSGFFQKSNLYQKKLNSQCLVHHVSGLPVTGSSVLCRLIMHDTHIEINEALLTFTGIKSVTTFSVNFDRLLKVKYLSENNIDEYFESLDLPYDTENIKQHVKDSVKTIKLSPKFADKEVSLLIFLFLSAKTGEISSMIFRDYNNGKNEARVFEDNFLNKYPKFK